MRRVWVEGGMEAGLAKEEEEEFPVWYSRLWIWRCRSCGAGDKCSVGLIPGPGNPTYREYAEKKNSCSFIFKNYNYVTFKAYANSKTLANNRRKVSMGFIAIQIPYVSHHKCHPIAEVLKIFQASYIIFWVASSLR